VGGRELWVLPDGVGRTFSTTRRRARELLLISQSSRKTISASSLPLWDAQRRWKPFAKEFAQDLAHHKVEHITVDSNVADRPPLWAKTCAEPPGSPEKTFNALGRENVNLIAIAQGSSNATFPSSSKSKP